jgi:UDP-glucuronate 4-epimerase
MKRKIISKILVTGCAGFIGMHVARRLLDAGHIVIGVDNLNDYYDVKLKKDRVKQLARYKKFKFSKQDIADKKAMAAIFKKEKFDIVVNLAAQPGVRYSITNPDAYISSNIVGFLNILEGCRHSKVKHLVYASSSSIYGANKKIPYSTRDQVNHPISLYAATKRANELMAHTYSHLYDLPTTGLRFFTVYGPWGRPDMASYLFANAIMKGEPIQVFNHGNMLRDFTYVDDIVEGVIKVIGKIPKRNPALNGRAHPAESHAPFKVYNIGNNKPVRLNRFIEILENKLGKKANKKLLPLQPGDVLATHADIRDIKADVGFEPKTNLEKGMAEFVGWYKDYHGLN